MGKQVTNILEHKRAVPVPVPTYGHAIIHLIAVEQMGRIVVPTYTDPNADPNGPPKSYNRARVIACSNRYILGVTEVVSEIEPGDYVLFRQGAELTQNPIELPDKHILIRLADVLAYHKCKMAEPQGNA